MMAKRAKPEEIIAKLREAEVRLSQGESVGMAAKSIENFNQQGRERDMGVVSRRQSTRP